MNKSLIIDTALVRNLVDTQFPQWKDLPIRPVVPGGWDNKTFRLGEDLLVRLPSAAEYASQVEKEQQWLPKLAPLLPLQIPVPLALGEHAVVYPWKWSIYPWLEGEPAASARVADLSEFAVSLAHFLRALQRIDSIDGPVAGAHSFFRGGSLAIYDAEVRQALVLLKGRIDVVAATKVWERALMRAWQGIPVWVHGDVSAGNLLVKDGRLCAVIDFGQLAVGDPACDLAIAWTFFQGESRAIFRATLSLDDDTWARGQAWALWKALIVASGLTNPNNFESTQCWRVLNDVMAD